MNARGYQNYEEQSLSTMTQGELLLRLYDELVKRLLWCDIALKKQDFAMLEEYADRSLDILRYLDDTLDRKYPISLQLHRLYDFFCYELNRIKMGRNQEELDKIRPMVEELRESFRTAEQNAVIERAANNPNSIRRGGT